MCNVQRWKWPRYFIQRNTSLFDFISVKDEKSQPAYTYNNAHLMLTQGFQFGSMSYHFVINKESQYSNHSQKWFWIRSRFPSNPIVTVELTYAVCFLSAFWQLSLCMHWVLSFSFFKLKASSVIHCWPRFTFLRAFTDDWRLRGLVLQPLCRY